MTKEVLITSGGRQYWCKVVRETRKRVLVDLYYPSVQKLKRRWYPRYRVEKENVSETGGIRCSPSSVPSV